jgi:hypothetical protein
MSLAGQKSGSWNDRGIMLRLHPFSLIVTCRRRSGLLLRQAKNDGKFGDCHDVE